MTQAALPVAPPRSSTLKIWLIVATVAAFVTVPVSLFWAGISVMSTTTTTNTAWSTFYVWMNLAVPLLIIVGVIGGWIAWWLRRTRLGWILLFSPVVPMAISLSMMAAWPQT